MTVLDLHDNATADGQEYYGLRPESVKKQRTEASVYGCVDVTEKRAELSDMTEVSLDIASPDEVDGTRYTDLRDMIPSYSVLPLAEKEPRLA